MPTSSLVQSLAGSPRGGAAVLASLAALMMATRVHHFGTALHLPDASMAVFFLAGLLLPGLFLGGTDTGWRAHVPFLALVALAVGLDWASIAYGGVSDFCITVAYSFLLPAYAVLWYGGRWAARRFDGGLLAFAGCSFAALASAAGSFLISNGSFYWLGGRYPDPHMAQYLERLWQWGPLFVRTTMAYVLVALVLGALVAALTPVGTARRSAGA
jgi:hypothetical protein